MRAFRGVPVLETVAEIVDPKHTALLVVDVQNELASPEGASAREGNDISWIRKIVPNIQRVLAEARRLGVLVIFERYTMSADGIKESGPWLRFTWRSARSRGLVEPGWNHLEGTWGQQALDELEPRANEPQFAKYRSSAFVGTPLDMILRNRGVKSVIVVGTVTEGCVETAVREANQHDYYSVLLSDCVASRRPDLHAAALLVMSERWDVITSEELIEIWRKSAR